MEKNGMEKDIIKMVKDEDVEEEKIKDKKIEGEEEEEKRINKY